MARHGKKYLEATKEIDRTQSYPPREALELARQAVYTKFDETVELHLRMGVDPRQANQQVRGTALLPHGLGKKIRILVLTQGEAVKKAQEAGADHTSMLLWPLQI
jgi:large subunit ribosomal protein L1